MSVRVHFDGRGHAMQNVSFRRNLNLILFSRSTPGAQLVLPKLTLPPASYVSHKI